jgi:two-component system sensor histidine kinase and response regulator WspE
MTSNGESGSSDAFMLELFCSEVETQVTALSEGLLTLEQTPQDAVGLEALMRAAHSIKGAARIVQLNAVVELAHTLEDCFVAAQEGRLQIAGEPLEVLLHGADQLAFLVDLRATELTPWLTAHEASMREAAQSLRALLQPGMRGVPPPATDTASSDAASSVSPTEAAQSTDATTPPPPEAGEDTSAALDPFMLDLFHSEVETQVTLLSEGLLNLERAPGDAAGLEALMRAAHSIKGAARIVQLNTVVELAHALEDCFVAAQEGRLQIAGESLEILLRSVDLLVPLMQQKAEDMASWLTKREASMQEAAGTLRTLLRQQAAGATPATAEQSPAPSQPQPSSIAEATTFAPSSVSPRVVDTSRSVRVSAENLGRLLGLAEETVVGANWVPSFAASLLRLHRSQRELAETLVNLRESVASVNLPERTLNFLADAQRMADGCRQVLTDRLKEVDNLVRRSVDLSEHLYEEAMRTRMRPFADGTVGFPRMMRDLAKKLGKQVKFEIVGQTTLVDRDILEKLEAPLTHLLRNALDHGIELPEERVAAGKAEEGTIRLEARHQGGMLAITISDDGQGADMARLRQKVIEKQLAPSEVVTSLAEDQLLRFLFVPGFSTSQQVTEISGRGVGLDIVQNMVREVGGGLRAVSQAGKGMWFHLQLPLTLSILRALMVEVAGEPYAFPLARIDQVLTVPQAEIAHKTDRRSFFMDGQAISLVPAHQVWQLPAPETTADPLPVIILSSGASRYGIAVDTFLGESDLIVRPLDERLGRVPGISAAALLKDGAPVLIADVEDLVRSVAALLGEEARTEVVPLATSRPRSVRKRILVVEDTAAMRTVERDILTRHGYEVDVAEDGVEGWDAIRLGRYDLLVSDVEMPRMDGIKLVSLVKQEPRLLSLPVLIVSGNEREEDRRLGLAAGANDYLTKSSFREETFIHVVEGLIGAVDK